MTDSQYEKNQMMKRAADLRAKPSEAVAWDSCQRSLSGAAVKAQEIKAERYKLRSLFYHH